jgi:hypothetical protein
MRASVGLSVIVSLTLLGCAGGGGGGNRDGATEDPDGGRTQTDGGRRDSGGGVCASGQHRCGGGCIDDLANEPANGCRYGCGEACPTPPDGSAACDEAGLCTFACPPPFHREGTECVCTARTCEELAFQCGAPDDGCGTTLDCGSCEGDGVCIEGACACTPDEREPNDSRLSVPMIGSLTDSPDSEATVDTLNLHDASDEDWFSFDVADNFDAGNPQINVTLDDIPAGSNYDLAAYYVCTSGGDSSTCTAGMADNMIGRGCASASSGTTSETVGLATECSGSDDGGRLYLRITQRAFGGSCAAYLVHVAVN